MGQAYSSGEPKGGPLHAIPKTKEPQMKRIAAALMLLAVLGSLFAFAGDNPNAGKTPKYIWIQTEQYQPAKEQAYMKLTGLFKETMAPAEFYWLAGMPLVGNGSEVTYVMFLNDFASMEKVVAAFEKAGPEMYQKNAALVTEGMAAISHSHSVLAEVEPELSFGQAPDPAQVTRWRVMQFQVRPGMGEQFEDLIKEVKELHAKANDGVHVTVYRLVDGAPGPVFFIVRPLRTLADLDQESSPAFKALLTPLLKNHFNEVIKKTVVAQKSTLFTVQPRLSNPPKSYLAANPGFWSVKEPAPAVAKSKKHKKTTEPAAMKEKK
jgi:hypothetical protein